MKRWLEKYIYTSERDMKMFNENTSILLFGSIQKRYFQDARMGKNLLANISNLTPKETS